MKGVYCLILCLSEDREIRIGKSGTRMFKAGRYIYTGKHMVNVEKRIARHFKKDKVLRWHIDYLRAYASSLVSIVEKTTDAGLECKVAGELCRRFELVEGFGNSDCKKCPAHLVFAGNMPLTQIMDVIIEVFKRPKIGTNRT